MNTIELEIKDGWQLQEHPAMPYDGLTLGEVLRRYVEPLTAPGQRFEGFKVNISPNEGPLLPKGNI